MPAAIHCNTEALSDLLTSCFSVHNGVATLVVFTVLHTIDGIFLCRLLLGQSCSHIFGCAKSRSSLVNAKWNCSSDTALFLMRLASMSLLLESLQVHMGNKK